MGWGARGKHTTLFSSEAIKKNTLGWRSKAFTTAVATEKKEASSDRREHVRYGRVIWYRAKTAACHTLVYEPVRRRWQSREGLNVSYFACIGSRYRSGEIHIFP